MERVGFARYLYVGTAFLWAVRGAEMPANNVAGAPADALVTAAASDTVWPIAQERFAALFAGSQFGPNTQAWLDSTHRALRAPPLAQLKGVRGALTSQWTTRMVDLLNEQPAEEAELSPLVTDLQTLLAALPGNPPAANPGRVPTGTRKSWLGLLQQVTPYLASTSYLLFSIGFVFIGFYAFSNGGKYLGNMAVGWLTAYAAFAVGGLVGLVVGIPRFISPSALRRDVETGQVPVLKASKATPGQPAADQGGQDRTSSIALRRYLAEISDWLTKLLLGAGLVELTRMGRPLGTLIDDVATGLGSATSSGKVFAGALLLTYVTLGFIDVYVVTTLWYGKHLQELGYYPGPSVADP